MKLVFCVWCSEIYSLTIKRMKSCHCGKTKGRYVDQKDIEIFGDGAVVPGFGNPSFVHAVRQRQFGMDFTAFVIAEPNLSIVRKGIEDETI